MLCIKEYDVLIIGAGPAGLFTAINCEYNKRVLILEGNSSAGKKLLLSGAGQCNITHEGDKKHFLSKYGENKRFIKNALYTLTNKDLMDFFQKRGLSFISNENGKVFPDTMKANDVLKILLDECEKNKVHIKYNSNVEAVECEKNVFIIKTKDDIYRAEKLVIATGGKSYPDTGSRGGGYDLGKKLGHAIEKPKPTLTPIYIKNYYFSDLSGISFENIPFSLWRDNRKLRDGSGDILFTHKGLSGPGILNFSRFINKGDVLKLNFIKVNDEEEFRKSFIEKLSINGKSTIKSILRDLPLPKRFIDKLLEISSIPEEKNCSQLKKDERNQLIEFLISFPMEVDELGGFHLAMATRGGISLKDIKSKTMESRLVEGLYFVGEVLDIDGDTGGYNIQAAFSTGFLAAKSINGVT